MPEKLSPEEMNKALFTNLVMMLGSSAMQQLGKLVNPVTNQTEVNLDGAQITIDMIEMLKTKTEGNLDEDENKLITDLLSSLQMNYVETAKAAPKGDDQAQKQEPAPEQQTETEPAPDEQDKDGQSEKKDPKFHKSYGE